MTDANPANPEDEGIVLPSDGDAAFSSLMDALAPDVDETPAGEGAGTPDAPAAGDGSPAAPAEGAGAAEAQPGTPAAGDAGGAGLPEGSPAAPGPGAGVAGADQPADAPGPAATGLDAETLAPKWGEVLTGLETRQTQSMQQSSYAEVREEFGKYFEAVEAAPRTLVGKQVPKIDGAEGEMEVIRDSADARDWQEAAKQALSEEIKDRTSRKMDDVRGVMDTLTRSVEIFQKNTDLIPNTRQFNKALADEAVAMMKPYELRVDGKLLGYTIDVQPLIDSVRARLAASAPPAPAAPAAPAAPSAQQQRAAAQPRNDRQQFTAADAPQAGIPSKAGASGEGAETFDTLFGTLGFQPGTIRI